MSIDLDGIRARLARVAGRWPTKGVLAPGADEFGPKAWSAHGPLRCHATEKGRARQWSQANADADFIAAAPADIAALLDEVERLRAEVSYLRACVPPAHPTDYGHEAWTETVRAATQDERNATVAFLRSHADLRSSHHHVEVVQEAADMVERGAHLMEDA